MFWVSKFMPKSGELVIFFWPTFSESVNSVWVLNYQCQAQQKFSSENIASYLHVEPIPTPKKNKWWQLLNFFAKGLSAALGGARKGATWSKNPLTAPLWKYIQRNLCQVSFCNLAWCLETCRAFGRKKQWRKRGREQKVMFVLLFFCYVFVMLIFLFFLPGFLKITFGILDDFWFCFLHFVRFTNPDHRAK